MWNYINLVVYVKVGEIMQILHPYQLILAVIGLYVFISILFACLFNLDLTAFEPMRNYKKWKKFNWVGVWMGTIFLHIIYLPLAIFYWVYRLLTFGRK